MTHRWVEAALAASACTLVALLFFHPLLLGDGLFASVDMVKVHVPFRHFIDQSLHQGALPLWVPGLWLGAPFLANGDSALLYPLQFPLLLIDPARGVGWVIWLHAALSMATMYAFARISLKATPAAAFSAGIVFAFNGYALSHTLYLSEIYLSPWPPLVFLAVERTAGGAWRWACLIPPPIALCILAGNPQELYFTALWWPLYCVALALALRSRASLIRSLAALLAGGLVGAALAAVQVLPQLELTGAGVRGGAGLTFQQATLFPLARRVALTLPLPDYLHTFSGENAAWIGLLGTLLVLAGLARCAREVALRPLGGFFLLLILGSAVLALGASTPLYRPALAVLPGLHQFRFPVRWLYPATIGFSALVAIGVDEVRRRLPAGASGDSPLWPALVAGALVIFLLSPLAAPLTRAWSAHRLLPLASALAIALAGAGVAAAYARRAGASSAVILVPAAIAIELFGVSQFMEWNHPYPAWYYRAARIIPNAIVAAGSETQVRVLPLARSDRWQDSLDRAGPNTNLLFGRDSVAGEGGNWPAGRSIALQSAVLLPAAADEPSSGARTQLWRALGVTHVVGDSGQAHLAADPDLVRVTTTGRFVLYSLSSSLPRAWLSCGAIAERSASADLQAVLVPSFQAEQLHVEAAAAPSRPHRCGSARFSRPDPNSLTAQVTSPEQGWLVFQNSYSPGWEATVDGRPASVVPADYFLQAVPVPPGAHRVRLAYAPRSFRVGLAISTFALIAWALSLAAAQAARGRISWSGRSPARGSR